jgi:Kyanoviridae head maturation protease
MIQLLTESRKVRVQNEGRKTFLEGIFAVADEPTKNSRVYSRKVSDRAIENLQEKISEGRCFSELGHSQSMTVDLNRVCGVVKSIHRQDNEYRGRIQIVQEGAGRVLQGILEATNNRIGVSSKGTGSVVKQGGLQIVQEDYSIATWDTVADNASPRALCKAIQESIASKKLTYIDSYRAQLIMEEIASQASLRPNSYPAYTKPSTSVPNLGDDSLPGDFRNKDYGYVDGHSGFSTRDDSTWLKRSTRDTNEIVSKLLRLDNDPNYDFQRDGLDLPSIKSYIDSIQNPLRKSQEANRIQEILYNASVRRQAVDVLARLGRMYGKGGSNG